MNGLFQGLYLASDSETVGAHAKTCEKIAVQFLQRAARLRMIATALRADELAKVAASLSGDEIDTNKFWSGLKESAATEEAETNSPEADESAARPAETRDRIDAGLAGQKPAAPSNGARRNGCGAH